MDVVKMRCPNSNPVLDRLVSEGTITGYEYRNVDKNGTPDQVSKFRNTEQLIIHFNDGKSLSVDTFCSGSAEDTTLFFNSPARLHTDNPEQPHTGDPSA